MDETIRININIDDRAIRDLDNVISDLNSTIGILASTTSDVQSAIQDLATEMGSSAFDSFDQVFNTLIATLALFASSVSDTKMYLGDFVNSLTVSKIFIGGFKGVLAGLGVALKAIPFVAAIWGAQQLFKWLRNLSSGTNDASHATDNLAERLENLRNSSEHNRQSHESTLRSIRANNQTTNDLIDTVIRLSGNTGDCVDKQNELKRAVELLNHGTSDYTLSLNKAGDGLDYNSEQIIENMRSYHDLNATVDTSEAILGELLARYDDMNYARDKISELGFSHDLLEKSYDELQESLDGYLEELQELNDAAIWSGEITDEQNERYLELKESIRMTEEAMDPMCDQLLIYSAMLDEATTAIYALENQLDSLTENVEENMGKQALSYETLSDAQREVVDQLVDRWTEYRDNAREMFSRVTDDTELWGYHTNEAGERVQGSFRATEATQEEVVQSMIDNMRANREATA